MKIFISKNTLPLYAIWLWSVIWCVLDQASKWGVLKGLHLNEIGRVDVLPGYIHFIMAWNKGVNFGWFYSESDLGRWLLIILPFIVAFALSWWCRKDAPWWQGMACSLMIGGAIGNAIDRMVHGAVVDFLNVTAFGVYNPFSFNVADIWVFAGAFILIFLPSDPKDRLKSAHEDE